MNDVFANDCQSCGAKAGEECFSSEVEITAQGVIPGRLSKPYYHGDRGKCSHHQWIDITALDDAATVIRCSNCGVIEKASRP